MCVRASTHACVKCVKCVKCLAGWICVRAGVCVCARVLCVQRIVSYVWCAYVHVRMCACVHGCVRLCVLRA